MIFDDPFNRNFFDGGFKDIIVALEEGRDCLVCDVNFCHSSNKAHLDRFIAKLVPGVVPQYVYFGKEEANCRANILGAFEASARTAEDADIRDRRLAALDATKDHYAIPPDAEVIPVPNYFAPAAPAQTAAKPRIFL